MTDPGQDEAFETYLKRQSVLPSELLSDDRLEPPAALDAMVLKKAREAIKAPAAPDQGRQQMYRAPRWAVPVALAATIMLCLSVVMNISLNTNRPTPAANLQRMTAARADVNARTEGNISADRRESVPGDIPSREIILPEAKVASSAAPHPPVVAEQAPGPPPPASAPMAQAPAPAAAPGALGSGAPTHAKTAPDALARAAPAPGAMREASSAYPESALQPPASEEPRLAARSATDKAAMFAKRADASVPGAAPSAAGAARDSTTETDGYRAAAPAEPPAAGAPAPDVATATAVQAATAGRQQPAAAAGPQAATAGGPQPAPSAGPQAATAGGPQPAPSAGPQAATADGPQPGAAAGRHPADPKAWLQQIDALRAAGKIDRADAEMRRFRAAFPGYAAKPAPPASSESPK
jgi:hypothetical protein